MSEKNYYTVAEIQSELFGKLLTKQSIYRLIKRGDIPTERYLKKHLIPRWWVDEKLAAVKAPSKNM